ncbi:MAG: SEC-C domain-containing protein [Myxococcales bacterium]|nr:SEC-C domain-containing protein [Myxococcales bacterium]
MKARLGPTKPCPCQSGVRYEACCRPLHTADALPSSAEALMRSRFAAFVLGDVDYLVATLAPEHEDLAAPRAALVQTLRETCRTARFMGLTIVSANESGDGAWVQFRARVFSGGQDRSFEETSEFRRVDGAWRYVGARAVSA